MNLVPVADAHNDLLSYLAACDGRTPHDLSSRSAISQLRAGGVRLLTLAIGFMTTPRSVREAEIQMSWFKRLLTDYAEFFAPCTKTMQFDRVADEAIHILPAFENASGFALEDEPLDEVLARLERIVSALGSIFYISLTWNGENRFGGGVGSLSGLKEDGKELLKWLDGKRIAVDISHASDRLVIESMDAIDRHRLHIPLIASHSNYRAIKPVPRNLPDEFVRELVRRKGLIGLNFFAPFVGGDQSLAGDLEELMPHVEHALKLGAEDCLCFGADFFPPEEFPHLKQVYPDGRFFFSDCEDVSHFPNVLRVLEKRLQGDTLANIAYANIARFLKSEIL